MSQTYPHPVEADEPQPGDGGAATPDATPDATDVPDATSPQEVEHDTPHDDDTPGPGKRKHG